jgi:hypothetical protein
MLLAIADLNQPPGFFLDFVGAGRKRTFFPRSEKKVLSG